MFKVTYWQPLSARQETTTHIDRVMCDEPDGRWPCSYRPHYVLAWTVNESGLPGLGESRRAYVCSKHMGQRIDQIPFEYTGSVTISPYREEQV